MAITAVTISTVSTDGRGAFVYPTKTPLCESGNINDNGDTAGARHRWMAPSQSSSRMKPISGSPE